MFTNRFFNVMVVLVLLLVIGLTVREAVASAAVASSEYAYTACGAAPVRPPSRSEYFPAAKAWVSYAEGYPTGVDGGLIEILSERLEAATAPVSQSGGHPTGVDGGLIQILSEKRSCSK